MVALARTRELETPDPIEGLDPRAATRILSRATRARTLRFGEALALPARSLGDLPLAPSLALRVAGVPGYVRVELEAGRAEAARSADEVVLDAAEWRAIALGAEADRLWASDFAALCARKRSDRAFRIDEEVALASAQPDAREEWPAARVLERVGAEVVAIELA